MNRIEYALAKDHKWGGLKLVSKPAFPVAVPFNAGYPASVTTNPATTIKASGATLNGILTNDAGAACQCGFQYGLTTAYGNTTSTVAKTIGQTFSKNISGLLSNRIYHFRAFADPGGSVYGADRTFKTLGVGNTNVDQLIYQHVERMQR